MISYFDENGHRRKKTGATDKGVTERMARDLENRVALRREGMVDARVETYRDHGNRTLKEHLTAWAESLESRGSTGKYIGTALTRARRIVALVRGAKLADIDPPKSTKRSELPRYEAALSRAPNSWMAHDLKGDLCEEVTDDTLFSRSPTAGPRYGPAR